MDMKTCSAKTGWKNGLVATCLTLGKLLTSLVRLPKQCSGIASFRAAQTKELECIQSPVDVCRLQLF
jgi:hypothetical protein